MASEDNIMSSGEIKGGKIVFAPDVIATIASLAANEVEGIDGMSGKVVDGIAGILSKKGGTTKGIKVDVAETSVAIDISAVVKYGYKIHEVAAALQQKLKSTVENMTGLDVTAVNVSIQSISFEKPEKAKDAEVIIIPEENQ